jgi:hypothetical protein
MSGKNVQHSGHVTAFYNPRFESRKSKRFFLFPNVQVGCGAFPASYSMDNRGSFTGDKVAEA